METVLNKLQEGVKYPHFERDATRIINNLVTHITNERGIYSSDIEPNPNEHKVWFNTNTNTLMIYNNYVWRNFNGSGGSSGWNVENALCFINEEGNLEMGNIKDKTFYILDLNVDNLDYIEILNLSDDIEFYIFISSMPVRLYFPNSNIITNYDTIVRHTTTNNIVGMSVLAHKVGITVEFSIINDKTDASNKNYVYNTKAESALLPFIGEDNNMYYIIKDAIVNENNLNQIEALLPSNVVHKGYFKGTLCVVGNIQIVYYPFRVPIDYVIPALPNILVFKNPMAYEDYYPLIINSSENYNRKDNLPFNMPDIAIFDKFNPKYDGNNTPKCYTAYPLFINNESSAIVIKDHWYIESFTGLYNDIPCGFDILLDDFLVNVGFELFDGYDDRYIANVIINNSTNRDSIEDVLYSLCNDTNIYKPNEYSKLQIGNACDYACTIIFTTICKTNMIYIPYRRINNEIPVFVILPYKVDEFYIKTDNDLKYCGNTIIVTIPDNYNIINNYVDDVYTNGKPLSDISNIHINTTLIIESKYDDKGLLEETYKYKYNDNDIESYFNRIDTPLIG